MVGLNYWQKGQIANQKRGSFYPQIPADLKNEMQEHGVSLIPESCIEAMGRVAHGARLCAG
jgi:hypothetical protein